MKYFLDISNFLEENSSLYQSIVFLYIFALITEAFLSLLAVFWNSAFRWVYLSFSPLPFTSFLSSAICQASSDSHFSFLPFFFLGRVLIPASCTMSWTSIHSSLFLFSSVAQSRRLFATPGTIARQAPLSMGILQARIREWVAMPPWQISIHTFQTFSPHQWHSLRNLFLSFSHEHLKSLWC